MFGINLLKEKIEELKDELTSKQLRLAQTESQLHKANEELKELKLTVGVWRKTIRQSDDMAMLHSWILETPEEWEPDKHFKQQLKINNNE